MYLKQLLAAAVAGSLGLVAWGETVIKPQGLKDARSTFAIVADTPTWQACKDEISEFAAQLGSEELPTFVVYDNWKRPEQVKKVIKDLYKKHRLEGVMFVGDVPVAMVRKAQHLTSAFKMSEKSDWWESSVPSDRFYDDFDLVFDYIRPDSVHKSFHYYDLAATSPQQIKCDIYSARVKPIKGPGMGDANEQVRHFFRKATAQHKEGNKLDQFYSHTGDGSYSNSLNAWTTECQTLREQMPGTFDSPVAPGRARFTRYSFAPYTKEDIITQVTRPDLDLTIFHEHGVPERQYTGSMPATDDAEDHAEIIRYTLHEQARRNMKNRPEDWAKIEKKALAAGLTPEWWSDYEDQKAIEADSLLDAKTGILLTDITEFKPNSRMVIFDACYNGDFREDDCIASRYIFADGNTVTTFGNSVNVLQDKQANEMLGLLWAGARVGQWAQETNILESHILGDPTYRFVSSAADVDGAELCRAPYTDGAAELAMLQSPYADVRNLAMHRMWRNDAKGLSELYKKVFLTSPVAMERFTALSLLEKINDQNYRDVLPKALNDPNEFIRRTTVTRMGKVGLDEYVEPLVEMYFDDTQAERVVWQIESNIKAFSEDAFNRAIARHEGTERAKKLRDAFAQQKSSIEGIMGAGPQANWRRIYTQSLRMNNIHPGLDGFLALAEDENVDEDLRLTMIEALAWYDESYRRDDIRAVCDRLRKKGPSKAIRAQAERTYYRLNNPNPSNK